MSKRWLAGLMIALLGVAGCASMQAATPLSSSMQSHPDRYVVVTVSNDPHAPPLHAASSARGYDFATPYTVGIEARRTAHAIAVDHDLSEAAAWPITALGVHCLVYRIQDKADRNKVLDALVRDTRVESAQPLETFTTQAADEVVSYNDPYAPLQKNLLQLAVPETQRYSRGEGITVAIIDTGVDAAHPDLNDRVIKEQNFVDRDAAQFRRDPHGTEVAGVIAAVANNGQGIAGIAPAAKLLALKACWTLERGGSAQCNSFTLAQALGAAIDARVNVVNLSLAGPGDPLLARLVKEGLKRGIIFVCAAPPRGMAPGFPNEIETVLSVSSSEEPSSAIKQLTAPGRELFTLTPAGHYDVVSGNSFAAAEISGIVALLQARYPHLNAEQAHAALTHSMHTTLAENPTGSVDACLSLAALDARVRCRAYFEARSDVPR